MSEQQLEQEIGYDPFSVNRWFDELLEKHDANKVIIEKIPTFRYEVRVLGDGISKLGWDEVLTHATNKLIDADPPDETKKDHDQFYILSDHCVGPGDSEALSFGALND